MAFEEMAAFFDARVDGYEAHMLKNVAGSDRFYEETVRALPLSPGMRLLDLGCGTGLELDALYRLCPDARVTGIDLSGGMLGALRRKFSGKDLTLIQGDYFSVLRDKPAGFYHIDIPMTVEHQLALLREAFGHAEPVWHEGSTAIFRAQC